MLVRSVRIRGKHKLANAWEDPVYVVIDQQNEDIPVFVLKIEDRKGGKRTLHRNLLLPVNFLPITEKGTGQKITKPHRIDTTTDLVQSNSSDWD